MFGPGETRHVADILPPEAQRWNIVASEATRVSFALYSDGRQDFFDVLLVSADTTEQLSCRIRPIVYRHNGDVFHIDDGTCQRLVDGSPTGQYGCNGYYANGTPYGIVAGIIDCPELIKGVTQ